MDVSQKIKNEDVYVNKIKFKEQYIINKSLKSTNMSTNFEVM